MKSRVYHFFYSACAIFLLGYLPACRKAENIRTSAAKPEKELLGFAGTNSALNRIKVVHLDSDTVYTISQTFTREEGEQLVIDEGTVIKIDVDKGRLEIIIEEGGVIIANGTATNPIVFTSNTATGNQKKNWGGLSIRGKSVSNSSNPNGDPADFSGSLNYVRVEFGGLILRSVGNNTTIENVQVSYTEEQSSFEIAGGTFNARNLVSFACGGSADFYITQGYSGKMQNILAYRHPFFGQGGTTPFNALAGVFIENNPSNPVAVPYTNPVISNLTVLGPDLQNGTTIPYTDTSQSFRSAALVTATNAFFQIRNSLLLGFPAAGWYIDDGLTAHNVNFDFAQVSNSFFQCKNISRVFYIRDDAYPPYTKDDFKIFALYERYHNRVINDLSELMLPDPFDYDMPKLFPGQSSPVFGLADFSGAVFADNFFRKVAYIGATGETDWLNGWVNFTPLKTNYNFPG